MKIFGITLWRSKAPAKTAVVEKQQITASPVSQFGSGVWGIWSSAWETISGGWQRNLRPRDNGTILAFSGVYACISLISGDVSKMRQKVTKLLQDGTWQEVSAADTHGNASIMRVLAVLKKPNRYQTRIQFFMNWIATKLIHGNTYILKERNREGEVIALYVLDSCNVVPLVNEIGEVFYQLQGDYLAGFDEAIIVPASEIIHDRMVTFWHPLCGVSPIFACGHAAMQGLAIQGNSEKFFENMSIPSGVITAPGKIAPEIAARVKEAWQKGFSGENLGKVAVLGDAMEYHQLTIPASDAQLVEQLGWTITDVARCFHVPPYKLGLQTNVTFSNAGQLDQDYYSQCLQKLIEACEVLLDEGLELPAGYRTEFDLDGLLRMDPAGLAAANGAEIKAGYLAPNEARKSRNLPAVEGGDTPYMQQQNWPLELLADRDPPSATPAVPALPAPAEPQKQGPSAREIADSVQAAVTMALASSKAAEDEAEAFARRLIELAQQA